MQADHNDRYNASEVPSRHSTQTLITAIAVVILAGGVYLLSPSDDTPEKAEEPATPVEVPVAIPPTPVPAESVIAAPDIPEEAEQAAPEDVDPEPAPEPPPPPPTPEELDAKLRGAIEETDLSVGSDLEAALAAPYLFDRAVSGVDQLARGLVPLRTLNLGRPAGKFTVSGAGPETRVDPGSYARYNRLVASITALPTETIAQLFHRFRPELQDAYAALGYPADRADNTLIAALDAIISAPIRTEPPLLVSKGALWAYQDTSLENASDLHQQLLRTGPDNTRKMQAWASELRAELLRPQ